MHFIQFFYTAPLHLIKLRSSLFLYRSVSQHILLPELLQEHDRFVEPPIFPLITDS